MNPEIAPDLRLTIHHWGISFRLQGFNWWLAFSWGVALGWYVTAPSALRNMIVLSGELFMIEPAQWLTDYVKGPTSIYSWLNT